MRYTWFAFIGMLIPWNFSCTSEPAGLKHMPQVYSYFRLGRVGLTIPYNSHLKHASYSIQDVDIELADRNMPFNRQWINFLQEISDRQKYRELPTDKIGEILSTHDPGKSFKTAFYYYFDNTAIITCGGLLQMGPNVVKLKIDGDAERQQVWYERLLSVASLYEADSASVPGAFYIDRGYFRTNQSFTTESVDAGFKDDSEKVVFSFRTQTVGKEVETSCLGDFFKKFAGNAFFKRIRKGMRVVDGLKGHEDIFLDKTSVKHEMYFSFRYRGRPASVTCPAIEIELVTTLEQEEAIQLWDRVLDSIHKL